MRVAVVQFAPLFKEPQANLKTIESMVREAARQGAGLVVFPELATTGYSFMSVTEATPFAEVLDTSNKTGSFATLRALARVLRIAIVWGVMERDAGTGALHNSQVLVVADGRFWVTRKANSWGNDWLWATEGNASPPIGDVQGQRVGLLICADIRDKTDNLSELYEPGDADIVAFSANWGKGGFPSGRWVKFAKENKVFLCASNRYGQEENNDFGAGGIGVITPEGKILCEGLKWNQPCIVYADVP